jgi:alpha-N-arabinofuranosidase
LLASVARDLRTGEIILKVVNGGKSAVNAKLEMAGAKAVVSPATVFTLGGENQQNENSFADPKKVSPKETKLEIKSPQFEYTFPANSLTVLRIKTSN